MRIVLAFLTAAALMPGREPVSHAVDARKPGPQAATTSPPQLQPRELFDRQCLTCHGEEGRGTAKGPAAAYLERGNPGAGMPALVDLAIADRLALARYVLRLNVETIIEPGPWRVE